MNQDTCILLAQQYKKYREAFISLFIKSKSQQSVMESAVKWFEANVQKVEPDQKINEYVDRLKLGEKGALLTRGLGMIKVVIE